MTEKEILELRSKIDALTQERATIAAAAEARFVDPDDTTEVRGPVTDDGDLDEHAGLTDAEAERMDAIDVDQLTLEARIGRMEKLVAASRSGATVKPDFQVAPVTSTDDPFDFERVRSSDFEDARAQARTAIESMRVSDSIRSDIDATLDAAGGVSPVLSRYVVAHSSPSYRTAFQKYVTGAREDFTPAEKQAEKAAKESRAAITIGTGFTFPPNIDPQFVHSTAAATNPYRRLASVRTGTANVHYANVLAEASFAMQADGVESGDATGADSTQTVPAELAQGTLIYTLSSAADLPTLENELMESARRGKNTLEQTQFRAGTATPPQVEGVLDGAVVTRVTTATTTLIDDDIFDVINAVPVAHQDPATAAWVMMGATANAIRQLESTGGMRLWSEFPVEGSMTSGIPRGLLGLPVYIDAGAMNTVPAGLVFTTTEDVAIVGDWNAGYRIYDMVGSSEVHHVPYLTGTSANLPNGTSGLLFRWRFGGKIINADALRVMDIA